MSCAKDSERAETEARLQQAIAEYKKGQNKDPKDSRSPIRGVTRLQRSSSNSIRVLCCAEEHNHVVYVL